MNAKKKLADERDAYGDSYSKAFPLFIRLTNHKVVVVGGGVIATRRITTLCEFGCRIVVISPHVSQEIKKLMNQYDVLWIKRDYQPGDCEGATIAVAATNVRSVNQQVGEDCNHLSIPVSVADCKEESTFYFPGIACEGSVVVGITASGANHSLARRVTNEIKKVMRSLGGNL